MYDLKGLATMVEEKRDNVGRVWVESGWRKLVRKVPICKSGSGIQCELIEDCAFQAAGVVVLVAQAFHSSH